MMKSNLFLLMSLITLSSCSASSPLGTEIINLQENQHIYSVGYFLDKYSIPEIASTDGSLVIEETVEGYQLYFFENNVRVLDGAQFNVFCDFEIGLIDFSYNAYEDGNLICENQTEVWFINEDDFRGFSNSEGVTVSEADLLTSYEERDNYGCACGFAALDGGAALFGMGDLSGGGCGGGALGSVGFALGMALAGALIGSSSAGGGSTTAGPSAPVVTYSIYSGIDDDLAGEINESNWSSLPAFKQALRKAIQKNGDDDNRVAFLGKMDTYDVVYDNWSSSSKTMFFMEPSLWEQYCNQVGYEAMWLLNKAYLNYLLVNPIHIFLTNNPYDYFDEISGYGSELRYLSGRGCSWTLSSVTAPGGSSLWDVIKP